MNKKNMKSGVFPFLSLLCIMIAILFLVKLFDNSTHVLTYNEFIKAVKKGDVETVYISPQASAGVYTITGSMKDYEDNESFYLKVPLTDTSMSVIYDYQEKYKFELDTVSDPESGLLLTFLVNFLPTLLLVGFAFYFLTRQVNSNKSMDLGKSRAKLITDQGKVTFENVAGLVEEKEEVKELIDFLKNPKRFQDMGARIPKGVLLVGPPGTGKTLLAKSVAGEANVPFYYISGSDFVELFVGVGASRVRDMFQPQHQLLQASGAGL